MRIPRPTGPDASPPPDKNENRTTQNHPLTDLSLVVRGEY